MDASDGSTSSTSDRRSSFCRSNAASATERAACSRARRRAVWIAIPAWLTATRNRCVSIAVGKSSRPADTSTRPVSHGSASGRLVTWKEPSSGTSTSIVVTPCPRGLVHLEHELQLAGTLEPEGRQVSSGRPPSCGSSKRAYAPSSCRTPKSTLSRPVAISIGSWSTHIAGSARSAPMSRSHRRESATEVSSSPGRGTGVGEPPVDAASMSASTRLSDPLAGPAPRGIRTEE